MTLENQRTAELVSVPTGTLGHLASCRIEGLFGWRVVEFETAETGPTLLYGQNGTGKSTVLRIIDDVAHARWEALTGRPFSKLELTFRSGGRLGVALYANQFVVSLNDARWEISHKAFSEARRKLEYRRQRARQVGRLMPSARQAALFSEEDIPEEHRWALSIPELFPVFLIEDQRLVAPRSARYAGELDPRHPAGLQATVSRFGEELRNEIQSALSVYAAQSQALDRRFPMKIAEAVEPGNSGRPTVSVANLRELLETVQAERFALQEVGLLGGEEGPVEFDPRRLEAERVRPVIQAFAEDTLTKFEVLRNLRTRLELFSSFLNQHYHGKRVITNREDGFAIVLEDGSALRANQLSSGEQQILALAFRILFRSEPGTLILIDEPELSLHVLWQSTLIDDLANMGRARDVTFLLATHSPTLIGDRVELMRSLDDGASADGARLAREPHEQIRLHDVELSDQELEDADVLFEGRDLDDED